VFSGVVELDQQALLSFSVSGELTKVPEDYAGVKKGVVIATLDNKLINNNYNESLKLKNIGNA
jgi:hypothetical protein